MSELKSLEFKKWRLNTGLYALYDMLEIFYHPDHDEDLKKNFSIKEITFGAESFYSGDETIYDEDKLKKKNFVYMDNVEYFIKKHRLFKEAETVYLNAVYENFDNILSGKKLFSATLDVDLKILLKKDSMHNNHFDINANSYFEETGKGKE